MAPISGQIRLLQARSFSLCGHHGARSVIATDGIIGCPHEEGIDYPDGQVCPQCPFWADRDRSSGEMVE
jgi:hypothetical protein